MLTTIETMGPALRSSYNEMAALSQLLSEREQILSDGTSASFKEILSPIAARRKRPALRGDSLDRPPQFGLRLQ